MHFAISFNYIINESVIYKKMFHGKSEIWLSQLIIMSTYKIM